MDHLQRIREQHFRETLSRTQNLIAFHYLPDLIKHLLEVDFVSIAATNLTNATPIERKNMEDYIVTEVIQS
jgi:hypothetical protein